MSNTLKVMEYEGDWWEILSFEKLVLYKSRVEQNPTPFLFPLYVYIITPYFSYITFFTLKK